MRQNLYKRPLMCAERCFTSPREVRAKWFHDWPALHCMLLKIWNLPNLLLESLLLHVDDHLPGVPAVTSGL